MSLFDVIKYPVSDDTIFNGTLLDDIPTYMKLRWYRSIFDASDNARTWLPALTPAGWENSLFKLWLWLRSQTERDTYYSMLREEIKNWNT